MRSIRFIKREMASFGSARRKACFAHGTENSRRQADWVTKKSMRLVKTNRKEQVEALDREFVDAATLRTSDYTHVPPGSYTFKVIAANRDDVWNSQGAVIRISVLPHFYQTWWFGALVAVAVVGLGFLVYTNRINRLRQARQAQEEFSRQLLASQ